MLSLVYAPNPIFKQKAIKVEVVNDEIKSIADQMLSLMYAERAVGIGANMVGILKRVIVVDIMENSAKNPYVMINPEITWKSTETQDVREASLCFPGIDAIITRPRAIHVVYLDREGNTQKLECEGFLATVVQHEVDYLDGVVFLDYLSKMKRDILLAKMQKYIKNNPPHIHTAECMH
jgi:peptide deformylase